MTWISQIRKIDFPDPTRSWQACSVKLKEAGIEMGDAKPTKTPATSLESVSSTSPPSTQNSQRQTLTQKRKRTGLSTSTYDVLSVIVLLMAVLVGVAAYLLHSDPKLAEHLEMSLGRTSTFLQKQWESAIVQLATWTKSLTTSEPAFEAKLLTAEELRNYDGSEPGRPILLSILGKPYNGL